MKRNLLVLGVAAAVAAVVLSPVLLLADVATCSVSASSLADSIVNPPKGEDTEFFVSTGGVPNLMFVLDTSGSMRRLPPDGASAGWGTFEPAGNNTAGEGYGCSNTWANALTYASPCGTTTLERSPFNPSPGLAPPDYAEAKDPTGKYCPHMISGNQPPATDKPGFDPDFYPTFFAKDRVFHDTVLAPVSASDGWTDSGTNPAAEASIALFCDRFSAIPAKKTSCDVCMRDKGYFFEGTYQTWAASPSCATTDDCRKHSQGTCIKDSTGIEHNGNNDNSAHCQIPHVWFSGNFLNFHPPKFVMARKVLKDVLQSVRKIRLGLTRFNASGDGGTLVEKLNPPCHMLGSPSNFDANRTAVKNAINTASKIDFVGGTPLAETLLDVGNLYLTKNLPWFSGTYDDSSFEDAVATSNAKSVCYACQASAILLITDGAPSLDGKIPDGTFAASPATLAAANTLGNYGGMSGLNITGISSADCPVCNTAAEAADTTMPAGECIGQQASGACDDAFNAIPSYLPKVAWYLKNFDLRSNTENGEDGLKLTGKQSITTYTIGLGTQENTSLILEHTALAGGGLYNGGTGGDVRDASTLRDAIMKVLEDVNTRSTSFGSASFSSLQVAAAQGVLIPRFEPARSAHWDGHLYAFTMFSEFASGLCAIPPLGGSGPANGDFDCDGKCTSVFLQDRDGHFIQEDATGAFKKNSPTNLAACGPNNRCASCATPDANAPARPFWDAGSKLAPVKIQRDPVSGIDIESPNPDFDGSRTWDRRAVYTVVDSTGDNQFTRADRILDLRTEAPATLVPYLNIKGSRYCSRLATRLTSVGNPAGTTIVAEVAAGNYATCAKVILDYVRGADVFDERKGDAACAGFPNAYCTRKFQLGDVFHSSPMEVSPPLPSDGFLCVRGMHPQCLPSLFSKSIPNPADTSTGNANAYDDYSKHRDYKHRNKFVLAGANDGMLHAFITGQWIPASDSRADDPRTVADESKPPFEGRYDEGTGQEIWAFIPPDLLPKLPLLLEATHHFYVDATPMVRDVWVDGGWANRLGGSANANGAREGNEFHTVAIVGERRGGTHYFALDVTDAGDDLDAKPRFLWLYPQPTDPEQLSFGETYVDFLPKPPPVGPVRIDAGAPPCAGNRKEYSGSSGSRCFEERWIAFLSGGFDPQYTKGRGVHMVDVATGEEVFDFSQPPGPASDCDAGDDPRCHLNYPVAATVGMMMWGKEANFLSAAAVDGYFDTATFGDTGGQMWVLRFNDPGIIDAGTGRVKNWFGARVFQHGLTAATPACGLEYCGGQPFFYITSNLPLQANGLYRTLAGTGDRYNLLDPVGGTCGPDNIRACMIKGCTVKLDDGTGNPGAVFGVEPLLGTQSYKMDHPALCANIQPSTYTFTTTPAGAATCGTVTSKIDRLLITCPSTATCSGVAETTQKKASMACTAGGDSCDATPTNEFGIPIDTKGNADKRNWFFSIQVFEGAGPRKIFATVDEAKAYDAARLDETKLVNINLHDQNPANPLGSPDDRGWSYFFDNGEPSTQTPWDVTLNGSSFHIYRTDERTASVSAVAASCAFWNTMQVAVPQGAFNATSECPVNTPCKAGRSQLAYLYGAAPGTGGLCLYVDDVAKRYMKGESLAPPSIGKVVAYVSSGQVQFGIASAPPGQGLQSVSLGEAKDLATPVQWLPVSPGMHACRHAPKNAPPTDAACRQ